MYINRFSTTMPTGLAKKNLTTCKTDHTGHSTTCSVQLEMAQCKKWIFDILARHQNPDFGRWTFKNLYRSLLRNHMKRISQKKLEMVENCLHTTLCNMASWQCRVDFLRYFAKSRGLKNLRMELERGLETAAQLPRVCWRAQRAAKLPLGS